MPLFDHIQLPPLRRRRRFEWEEDVEREDRLTPEPEAREQLARVAEYCRAIFWRGPVKQEQTGVNRG